MTLLNDENFTKNRSSVAQDIDGAPMLMTRLSVLVDTVRDDIVVDSATAHIQGEITPMKVQNN